MSRENGRVVRCERCGESVFLKCTGEGERDGGFTRWNTFEPLPKGWGLYKWYDLCPTCNAVWDKIQRDFELTFLYPPVEEVGVND